MFVRRSSLSSGERIGSSETSRACCKVLVGRAMFHLWTSGPFGGLNLVSRAGPSIFFLESLGISEFSRTPAPVDFFPAGRPALEAFFRESLSSRARTLRERCPSSPATERHCALTMVPSGIPETHASIPFSPGLRRPFFRLDLGGGKKKRSVVRSSIHHVAMRKAFPSGKRSAPSLLILEEIDAVAPARGRCPMRSKVEELTESIIMIDPQRRMASWFSGTPTRREALDPAVLRKAGSITHACVRSDEEKRSIWRQGMLKDRPHT